MILADTSIWVEHLRRGKSILADLLGEKRILSHPFVIGELALGGIAQNVIDHLQNLPHSIMGTDDEVLDLIGRHRIAGRGIGYVDAHLLVSVRLTADAEIWTFDKRLRSIAEELGDFTKIAH